MLYKLTEENKSFIKDAIESGNLHDCQENLKLKLDSKEKQLLQSVSDSYISLINHCQELNNLILPKEFEVNLIKLAEVGNKIILRNTAEQENKLSLERVKLLIKEFNLVLEITRNLKRTKDLLELKNLYFVKKNLPKLYKYNFFSTLENIYKFRIVECTKKIKEKVADWIERLRNINLDLEITKKSVIFNELFELRAQLDLEDINFILLYSKKLEINSEFIFEFLHSFESNEDVKVFGLALYFLNTNEFDRFIDFDRLKNIKQAQMLIDLYRKLDEDVVLLENKHRVMSLSLMKENEYLLEENINLFLEKVDISYVEELAEFIDTFVCKKLVENIKVDVSKLIKDQRFRNYEWNWKIMIDNGTKQQAISTLREEISKLIYLKDAPFKIIKLLETKNCLDEAVIVLNEFYSEKLKRSKEEECKAEIGLLIKYFKEKNVLCNDLERLFNF